MLPWLGPDFGTVRRPLFRVQLRVGRAKLLRTALWIPHSVLRCTSPLVCFLAGTSSVAMVQLSYGSSTRREARFTVELG